MRIYIAEDEPLAAQKLLLFLQKLGHKATDIKLFSDGKSLLEELSSQPLPDLLFLDIQMPGLTGIEILSQLQQMPDTSGQSSMQIIITSAYERYAIDGFNFGVTDYLLKPYTIERLRQALAKVQPEPVVNIRVDGRIERVKVSDIVCLEAQKDYTQFTLLDGRRLVTLGTLSGFEQQLPPSLFTRVQRSYLVGLRHITSYNSTSVTLATGEVVPVGKTFRDSFAKAIANPL